uniref:Uncharacterized protein n=1 Tax=Magallana gigas TaxID=29159 RepID=K1RSJ3_MAGGI
MGETTITTDITARPGFEHELPELYALPISQAGQFPTYKRLTNGLPYSHQPSGLPFPIKEPSNMVKEELTYILKNKEMIKFEEKRTFAMKFLSTTYTEQSKRWIGNKSLDTGSLIKRSLLQEPVINESRRTIIIAKIEAELLEIKK